MCYAVGGLGRAGGDVVGDGVVDDPNLGGVVEGDGPTEVGRAVVDDHVVADVDDLVEGVEHEDPAAVVAGVVALDQVAVDVDGARAVAQAPPPTGCSVWIEMPAPESTASL